MPVIPASEWFPDAAAYGNPGSISIFNAVPGTNSYKPFRSLAIATSAMADRPTGAISVRDKDNNVYNYAGDEESLCEEGSGAWVDVTNTGGAYSTAAGEGWELVQWKNTVIATNFSDDPQQITLGAANFTDLTTAFKARHVAVIGDHVFFANTWDSTNGNIPWRIRWSAFDDETDYTVDPSTGADVRDLSAGGWIQKIIGGEYGVVVSERSTYRVLSVGAPTWFQIDQVLPGVGTSVPGSVVSYPGRVFFWSDQGVVSLTNATGVSYPGAGKWDQFLKNDFDSAYRERVSAIADPKRGRVYWAYPGAGHSEGRPNRILVYDVNLDRASLVNRDVELIWRAASAGQNLDDLTGSVDDIPGSLDDPTYVGGDPNLAAFDEGYQHGFFSGDVMTATIETRENEFHSGQRTQISAFRPLADGAVVTAQIGSRNSQSDPVEWGPVLSQTSTGRFTTRSNARYHRFRLSLSSDWSDAIGVQVEPFEARKVGRR